MEGKWKVKYECQRCHKQYGSTAEVEQHTRKRHGAALWTCGNCDRYQSERKGDVQRHEVGCKRRSRSVTTETIGEWDVSPGGTKTNVLGKRPHREGTGEDGNRKGRDSHAAPGGGKEEREVRADGKDEGERKEPGSKREEVVEEPKGKVGGKRQIVEEKGSCKRRVVQGGMGSLDPPLIQRVPTLAYLTALGSPIEKPEKTPRTPKVEQESEGEGQRLTRKEALEVEAHAVRARERNQVSFEIDVGPGTVWRKTIRTTHHPDGRVVIEEEEETRRVCDCEKAEKNKNDM